MRSARSLSLSALLFLSAAFVLSASRLPSVSLLAAALGATPGGPRATTAQGDVDQGTTYDVAGVSEERWSGDRDLADFSHVIHTARRLKTKCIDCHRLGVDGNRFRPSEDQMCAQCHIRDGLVEAFRKSIGGRPPRPKRGPVDPIHRIHIYYKCDHCHESVRSSRKIGDFPLPPTDNADEVCVECHSRAVRFSHAQHVQVDGKVGADCSFCHSERADDTLYSVPGHPQCWQCHDITLLGLTEGCNLCHLRDTRAPKTYALERAATLHREHPRDKVECSACHDAMLTADTLDQLRQARQRAAELSCKDCHAIPK